MYVVYNGLGSWAEIDPNLLLFTLGHLASPLVYFVPITRFRIKTASGDADALLALYDCACACSFAREFSNPESGCSATTIMVGKCVSC